MKYDFDRIISRSGRYSIKWDMMKRRDGKPVGPEVFPYSVADMEFPAAPEIQQELRKRIDFGNLGYYSPRDPLFSAFAGWTERRHGWKPDQEWMTLVPGVVPALYTAVRAFTKPGEGVIVQPPVYQPFYHAITGNRRRPETVELKKGRTSGGTPCGTLSYTMDFEAIEAAAQKPDVTMLLLCSPHNPVGRVWNREELARLASICDRNNVLVVSDEIHCDLLFGESRHIPFGTLNSETRGKWVVATAPSKTFNLAGAVTAVTVIADENLRSLFAARSALDSGEFVNLFGMTAFEAAYRLGEPWLEELLRYLEQNRVLVRDFFARNLPEIPFSPLEGTYLMWFDLSPLGMTGEEQDRFLTDEAEFFLNDGRKFGNGGGGFERLNIACPRAVLEQGLERFYKAVRKAGLA
ncbi:MAG: pyridoxal phosphate-dependent aminotransferase [Spirochaetaceae bacterium]|jgi:putative C-S lyase|nr:pyridoxal phosphate-dependent aminotransferase [Spirochaetaceae bacterium]